MTSGNGVGSTRGRLVALAQARTSGTTTAALALGLCWPRPVLLAELDPAGGVLAARFGLSPSPGLLSLAASGDGSVLAHAQPLGALPALVGPVGPEAAVAALGQLLPGLARSLGALDEVTLGDCGRLGHADSTTAPLLTAATLVVLWARPTADGVAHLRHRLGVLPAGVRARVVVALVGSQPYPPAEVADVLGVEVIGTLAWDQAAAELLACGVTSGLRLGRSALMRSARLLAEALDDRLARSAPLAAMPARLGAGRP